MKYKREGWCIDGFPFSLFGFSKSIHYSAFTSSLVSILTCYGLEWWWDQGIAREGIESVETIVAVSLKDYKSL